MTEDLFSISRCSKLFQRHSHYLSDWHHRLYPVTEGRPLGVFFFFFRNFEDVVFFFPSKINLSFLYSWDPFEDYAQSFLSSFNLLLHWTTNRLILNLKRKRVKDVGLRHVRPSGCSRCINWSCRPSGERHDIKKKVRYVNVLVQSTFKNCRN